MNIFIVTPVFQLYSTTVATALCQDYDGPTEYVLSSGDDLTLSHYARITAKYNRLRRLCLDAGADAMLIVEADMVVPPHALRCLLETEAHIAYGVYSFRHEGQGGLWNVAAKLYADGHADWLCADREQARRLWGKVAMVEGVGLGCTLIRRPVLEAIEFRDNGMVHCDWMLGMDAAALGFSQVAHLGVICGHIRDRDRAVWPDPTSDTMSRETRPDGGY